MYINIKSTLILSFALFTTFSIHADNNYPPAIDMPAPVWDPNKTPIAWGDCIPVPMNMPMQNLPQANLPMMNAPVPQMIPMPLPNYAQPNIPPQILPPPSPFFNNAPAPMPSFGAQTPNISCDNNSNQELEALKVRYQNASSASKNKISELTQALDDAQNQLLDGQNIINSLSKENESKNKDLSKNLSELQNENKTLQSKLTTAEQNIGAQARMLTSLEQNSDELDGIKSAYKSKTEEIEKLKTQLTTLDDNYKTLQAQYSKMESESGNQVRKLTALSQSSSELTALQSAYKEKNEESITLKDQIKKLEEDKLGLVNQINSSQTAVTLKSAQDRDIIDGLKKNISELDNENKTLKTKLADSENKLGSSARKITALDQNSKELTAIQSAYKDKATENETLKNQLLELEDANKSLQAKLTTAEQNTGSQARKLTALSQQSTELTALQSAYKERNDENAALKKQLFDFDNANKSIKAQLVSATANTSEQARKLTAFDQTVSELTALKSAFKDRNDKNAELKVKIAALENSQNAAKACNAKLTELQQKIIDTENDNKTLQAKITTLEATSANQIRRITSLTQTASELDALKSAYKDLTTKKVELDTKLEEATADTDKDGVLDSADKCPSSPEGSSVNNEGCPDIDDADKDGVADASDLCSSTPEGASVNELGCSETESITLKGVNFATGSARLTTESLPIINAAAQTLKNTPNLNIEIAGYTDNQGFSKINKSLSQRRANSVMIELIKQGVEATRLNANGYGESNPVATNDTEEGRATNRRVELKIIQ